MRVTKNRLVLGCTLLDNAALYSETYLNRDHKAGKRPRRVRVASWHRQQRKPSKCITVDCQNLDIIL